VQSRRPLRILGAAAHHEIGDQLLRPCELNETTLLEAASFYSARPPAPEPETEEGEKGI
jgi:hypothetical protein